MDELFLRFGSIYGHLWSSQFKSHDQLKLVKHEWALAVEKYTPDEIRNAISICIRNYQKPPNLPMFLSAIKRYQYRAQPKALEHKETPEQAKARKQRGLQQIQKMKKMLGPAAEPVKPKPMKNIYMPEALEKIQREHQVRTGSKKPLSQEECLEIWKAQKMQNMQD